jgi:hypothetical protein
MSTFEAYHRGKYNYNWIIKNESFRARMNCEDAMCPATRFGFHWPHSDIYEGKGYIYNREIKAGAIATLFRNPLNRVVSAFMFSGIMFPFGSVVDVNGTNARQQIMQSPCPICAYANYPGIASCQTKMVLGYTCGQPIELSEVHMAEARRRLEEDFVFIGLTEEPRATQDLFLATFNIRLMEPLPVIPNIRSFYGESNSKKRHIELKDQLIRGNWSDPFDQRLYEFARSKFYSRCQRYGVWTAHGE